MDQLLSKLRDRLTYSPAVEMDAHWGRSDESGVLLPPHPPNAPISREELEVVEKTLGFALPAVIRRISTEIADGGFGPDWGINRLKHPSQLPFGPHWMVEMSVESWHKLYHDETEPMSVERPERFVRYCEAGCNTSICIDCTTAKMFVDDPNSETRIKYLDQTIEEWLANWLSKPWPTDKYV